MSARQPALGLRGLLLVLPIAALLAFGAGGAEQSVVVLGPLVTYALPLVAMVAFWWENWPGTRLRPSWSGWADTALIAGGALVVSAAGATVGLGAAAFVAMLELTLAGEGWPLRRLPPLVAGPLAVAIAWAVALALDAGFVAVRDDVPAVLIAIGAWQTLFYVGWRGWPFSAIAGRARRLACAHAVVIAGGVATYLALHDGLAVGRESLAAWAACFVAAVLLVGMLLEGWLDRTTTLVAAVAMTVGLVATLRALAGGAQFTRASADEWVIHASLNALAVSVILHVAIGRRWPFGGYATSASASAARASRSSAAT